MKGRIIAIGGVAAVIIVGGIVLSGCSTQVGAGTTAAKVDDYLMIPADPKVEGCISPESSEFNPPGGFKVYLYPSRQISWDALDRPDAEAPATVVVSNASAPAEL